MPQASRANILPYGSGATLGTRLIYCLRSACHNAFAPTCLGFLVGRGFIDRNARAVAVWICQPSDIPFAGHLQRFRAINQPTPASCFMQCNQTLSGCIAPFVRRRSQAQPLHR